METQAEFKKWFRKMGYHGEIPNSLISVCNNSTYFIWEQLMQTVKPKQEVEHVRRNIILNRLKKKALDRQDDFLYQINAIDLLRRKRELEQQIKRIKEVIHEKQNKVEILSHHYNLQNIAIKLLSQKVIENEQREFILLLKEKDLNRRLQQAQDDLSVSRIMTPVEVEQSMNSEHVKELLEACAKRLQNIVTEDLNNSIHQFPKCFMQSKSLSKKKLPNVSSLETYINIQDKNNFEQCRFSSTNMGTLQEKENLAVIGNYYSVNVELFKTPKIVVEKAEEQIVTNRQTCWSPAIMPLKKRESLGILPESYLMEVDNELLQISNAPSVEDMVRPLSALKEFSSSSVFFNYDLSTTQPLPQTACKEYELKRILYNDTFVNGNLVELLSRNNKEFLYTVLQKKIDDLKMEFTKLILGSRFLDGRKKNNSEEDITKLFHVHVQTELKIIEQKNTIKEFLRKISKSKFCLLDTINSKENSHQIQEWLDMNIQQVGLEASLVALRKEIDSVNIVTITNDLQIITMKMSKAKNELASKLNQINVYIEEMYKLQKLICTSREQSMNSIWDMRLYKNDMYWVKPLTEGLWSKEVKLFESFPLEYQRRCIYSDPTIFYRDLCVDNYALDVVVSTEAFQTIAEILDSPFNPPETILLSIIKSKMKLEKLKSLRKMSKWKNQCLFQTNSLEEVERQESYVTYALEKLQSIIYSHNTFDTLSTGDVIKNCIDIWTEMPMKNFISPKRLLNGQSYHFYERKLRSLCGS